MTQTNLRDRIASPGGIVTEGISSSTERPSAFAPETSKQNPAETAGGNYPGNPAARQRTGRTSSIGSFRFLRKSASIVSVAVLAVVLAWALVPTLFTDADPITGNPAARLRPPSAEFLFGTDQLGRDVLARMIHGSSLSLRATLIAVAISLVVGVVIGLISGFFGGRVDDILMRIVDVLMAIPGLLLSMAIVTALGFGTVNVAIAVGIAAVASFARLSRGEVIRWKNATFVEAATASGVRTGTVIIRHVLPHAAGPVLALAALEFGTAVLAVSSLSFLGFGAPPPQPEWGLLVAEGRDFLASAWWLTTLPGLVVVAVVLAANQLSRTLQSREGTS
ncbi:ABC transporter permease [Saxibacter everestensis]|uniref:ABC transporter permease n=1 Tax=Saxibacter everestensis TaxID=2909229 RepID=A0ABY8QS86_9MICO|nr:ABC transporter permease [Brevibacteriaceae bacterium ZFBP1038]